MVSFEGSSLHPHWSKNNDIEWTVICKKFGNVCSAEKYTKRSSNTLLLLLVYFAAKETLFTVPCRLTLYTGSTIRNWQKVKTCLDQMFWQIYLMFSGFLSSRKPDYLQLFWPHAVWTASKKNCQNSRKFLLNFCPIFLLNYASNKSLHAMYTMFAIQTNL